MLTEQMTEAISIPVASLPPSNTSNNATAYTVGPVNMAYFNRIMAHIQLGVLTGAATVQAYFQSSNANNGTFANVTSGPTIGTVNTANTEYTLEMRGDQVPAGNSWVRLQILVSANAAFTAAALYGSQSPYKPAKQFDANSTILPTRAVMS